MISRTLGPEFGGSIGVLFFFANVFSSALYITGFTEALTNITGFDYLLRLTDYFQGIGEVFGGKFFHSVAVSFVILCLCLLGAEIFAKTALFALATIMVAYGSFIFTVFFKHHEEIPVPHENVYAYMVRENATDPESKMIVNFNQTLTVSYTSFR